MSTNPSFSFLFGNLKYQWVLQLAELWTRINWIRIQIRIRFQLFQVNPDLDTDPYPVRIQSFADQKLKEKIQQKIFLYLFLGSKIAIYLCPSYRRHRAHQKIKFINFFYVCWLFLPGSGSELRIWIRIRIQEPHWIWIRIRIHSIGYKSWKIRLLDLYFVFWYLGKGAGGKLSFLKFKLNFFELFFTLTAFFLSFHFKLPKRRGFVASVSFIAIILWLVFQRNDWYRGRASLFLFTGAEHRGGIAATSLQPPGYSQSGQDGHGNAPLWQISAPETDFLSANRTHRRNRFASVFPDLMRFFHVLIYSWVVCQGMAIAMSRHFERHVKL